MLPVEVCASSGATIRREVRVAAVHTRLQLRSIDEVQQGWEGRRVYAP
jgi:hypothetical protein